MVVVVLVFVLVSERDHRPLHCLSIPWYPTGDYTSLRRHDEIGYVFVLIWDSSIRFDIIVNGVI